MTGLKEYAQQLDASDEAERIYGAGEILKTVRRTIQ